VPTPARKCTRMSSRGVIWNPGYRGSSSVLRQPCRVLQERFQSNGTESDTTWIVYWTRCSSGAELCAVWLMTSENHTEIRFLIGSLVRQRSLLRITFKNSRPCFCTQS